MVWAVQNEGQPKQNFANKSTVFQFYCMSLLNSVLLRSFYVLCIEYTFFSFTTIEQHRSRGDYTPYQRCHNRKFFTQQRKPIKLAITFFVSFIIRRIRGSEIERIHRPRAIYRKNVKNLKTATVTKTRTNKKDTVTTLTILKCQYSDVAYTTVNSILLHFHQVTLIIIFITTFSNKSSIIYLLFVCFTFSLSHPVLNGKLCSQCF
jgi:hypothetical protein